MDINKYTIQITSLEDLDWLYTQIPLDKKHVLETYDTRLDTCWDGRKPLFYYKYPATHQGPDSKGRWPSTRHKQIFNSALPIFVLQNPNQYPEYFI